MTRSKPASGRRLRPRVSLSLLHKSLLFGGLIVVLASVTTLSIASHRIEAEQAAFGASPTVPRCEPNTFNVSDVLPGSHIAVSPLPDSYDSSPYTQISIVGVPRQRSPRSASADPPAAATADRCGPTPRATGPASSPAGPSSRARRCGSRPSSTSAPHSFAFHFVVSHPDEGLFRSAPTKPARRPLRDAALPLGHQLTPPVLEVTVHNEGTSPGYLFSAPYAGPGARGR